MRVAIAAAHLAFSAYARRRRLTNVSAGAAVIRIGLEAHARGRCAHARNRGTADGATHLINESDLGRAPAGRQIVANSSRVASGARIITGRRTCGDVVETESVGGRIAADVPDGRAGPYGRNAVGRVLLIHERHESGPERRRSACPFKTGGERIGRNNIKILSHHRDVRIVAVHRGSSAAGRERSSLLV